jgi:hypothetical protein
MQRVREWSGRVSRASALEAATTFSILLPLLLGSAAADAHHSFAMFDHVNRVTLAGTVTQFQWTNPHVFIELDVPDGNGALKHYSIECASPNVLMRVGWKYADVKKGDKVTLLINPLKNGDPGGMLETATLTDGRVMSDGNPPGGVFAR